VAGLAEEAVSFCVSFWEAAESRLMAAMIRDAMTVGERDAPGGLSTGRRVRTHPDRVLRSVPCAGLR
jgi:hypothetical protein